MQTEMAIEGPEETTAERAKGALASHPAGVLQ
jgi:hypothetical protein